MDYIVIQNKGLLIEDDLLLLGSSVKRNDDKTIGMYGTGFNRTLAWAERKSIKITIYSGLEEIKVGSVSKNYRNMDIKVLTVNGKETSVTTDMSPQWSGWMGLRELISNALDESEFKMEPDGSLQPKEEYTTIYIQVNEELEDVMYNYHKYFAYDRPNPIRVYIGAGKYINFFKKAKRDQICIFRKGIRCFDTDKLFMYDLDFSDLPINEDRIADWWDIRQSMRQVMHSKDLTWDILKEFINVFQHDNTIVPGSLSTPMIDCFKQAAKDGQEFVADIYVKAFGLSVIKPNAMMIPANWYSQLVAHGILDELFDSKMGIPTDFVPRAAHFDKESVRQYLNFFVTGIKIISGVFSDNYEEVRVVKDTVYVVYNIGQEPSYIAARIIKQLTTDRVNDILRAKGKTKGYNL